MPSVSEEGWAQLPSEEEFRTALAIRRMDLDGRGAPRWQLATEAIQQLSSSPLSSLVRVRRLTLVLGQLKLNANDLSALTDNVRAMPSSAKNLFASAEPGVEIATLFAQTDVPVPVKLPQFTSLENQPGTEDVALPAVFEASAIVLAIDDAQAGSKSVLAGAGVSAYRAQSIASLVDMLSVYDDICTVIVDGSFMRSISADEQRSVFQRLARHSSLLWIRVEVGSLAISEPEVEAILQEAHCRSEIPHHSLSFAPSGTFRTEELHRVERARKLVAAHKHGTILPTDLSSDETRVLMAAVCDYIRDWRDSDIPLDLTLKTRFIPGGRTGAKLVLVSVDDRPEPLVVKVGPKEFIHEEMKRFRTFIQHSDRTLHPSAAFHGPSGAIVFRLVQGDGNHSNPAPTLEHAIKTLRMRDYYGSASEFRYTDIASIVRSVAQKLERLNSQTYEGGEFRGYGAPSVSTFERLEGEGNWFGFGEAFSLARANAKATFLRNATTAVVHGDVNLRNVLVSEHMIGGLIDYANSGPGHPAVDLVRLEVALFLGAFAPTIDGATCRRLQEMISIELRTLEEICEEIDVVCALESNRAVLAGCLSARDSVLAVLETHGLDQTDYLATKLLVSWASLEVDELQHSWAREIIAVLSERMMTPASPSTSATVTQPITR